MRGMRKKGTQGKMPEGLLADVGECGIYSNRYCRQCASDCDNVSHITEKVRYFFTELTDFAAVLRMQNGKARC